MFGDPEKMKNELEKREMENDADTLVFEGMIAHLNKDELLMLSKFFFNLADPCTLRAAYYAGALAGYTHAIHHTSIDCFKEDVQVDQLSTISDNSTTPIWDSKDVGKSFNIYEYNADCVKYGVTPPLVSKNSDLELSYYLTKVVCDNCGVIYPSLKDRMLSKPGVEGCSGCQQKVKHG